MEFVDFLKTPEKYAKLGARVPKGRPAPLKPRFYPTAAGSCSMLCATSRVEKETVFKVKGDIHGHASNRRIDCADLSGKPVVFCKFDRPDTPSLDGEVVSSLDHLVPARPCWPRWGKVEVSHDMDF